VTGKAIAKIPVISNSQIDETLIEAGDVLSKFGSKRTEQTLKQFVDKQNSSVWVFVENINMINRLYNQPTELMFDRENIYIGAAQEE